MREGCLIPRIVLPIASTAMAPHRISRSPDQTEQKEQQHCADEGGDKRADQTYRGEAENAEKQSAKKGPEDSDDHIAY
jgi:hypothetical protein